VLLSGRLRRTVVTSAIFFLTVGILLGGAGLGWFVVEANSATLRLIAEATLALVLFSDASRINLGLLLHELAVPARLLGVGLPLTLTTGAVAAALLLPGLTPVEAALLAIAVAPTDAALGQAVVTDERVPSRIRQGLNVESGLNDGLCVPLLIIALAVASAEGGAETEPVRLILEEIGFGVVGGLLAGAAGAAGLRASRARGWLDGAWAPLLPIAVAGLAYGIATILHGSGLIAAFTAGLTFGSVASDEATESVDVVETIGDGFSAATFMLFGASVVPVMLDGLTWASLAFVVVALTFARMLPVAIALIGLHARPPTIAYLGEDSPQSSLPSSSSRPSPRRTSA
jgi:sodium/hydrogen antiporter